MSTLSILSKASTSSNHSNTSIGSPIRLGSSPSLRTLLRSRSRYQSLGAFGTVSTTNTEHSVSPPGDFITGAVYRGLLESALTEALTSGTRDRLAASTKLKKSQHEKAVLNGKLGRAQKTILEQSASILAARERVHALEKEKKDAEDQIRIAREDVVHEKEGSERLSLEEKAKWAERVMALEETSARERELSSARIADTERALSDARHLIHHLQETADSLQLELHEAIETKRASEDALKATRLAFSRYRALVSEAVDQTKHSRPARDLFYQTREAENDLRRALERTKSLESLAENPEDTTTAEASSEYTPSETESERPHVTIGRVATAATSISSVPDTPFPSVETPESGKPSETTTTPVTIVEGSPKLVQAEGRKAARDGKIRRILRRISSTHPSV